MKFFYFLFPREIVTKKLRLTLNTLAHFIMLTVFSFAKKRYMYCQNVFIRCNFCKCIWILLYLSAAAPIMKPSDFFSHSHFVCSFVPLYSAYHKHPTRELQTTVPWVGSLLLGQKKRNRKYLARLLKVGSYPHYTPGSGLHELCISVAWLVFFFGHNNRAVKLLSFERYQNHHRSFLLFIWCSGCQKHLLPFNLVHVKHSGRTTDVNFIDGMPVLSMWHTILHITLDISDGWLWIIYYCL